MAKSNNHTWFNKDALFDMIKDKDVSPLDILYTIKNAFAESFNVLEERIKYQAIQLDELPQLRSELNDKQAKCEELCERVQALQQVCQYKEEKYQDKAREANRLHNICELRAQSILESPIDANLARPRVVHSITKEVTQSGAVPRTRKRKDGFNTNPFIGIGCVSDKDRNSSTQFVKPLDVRDDNNRLPNTSSSLLEDGVNLDDNDTEFVGGYTDPRDIDRATELSNYSRRSRGAEVDSRLGTIGGVMTQNYNMDKTKRVIPTVPFKPTFPSRASMTQKVDSKVLLVGQRNKVTSDSRNAVIKMNKEMNEKYLRKLVTEPGPASRKILFERRRTKLWPHEDSFKRRV